MKKNIKYSKGFTLVELLLVIAIIAILATVLFVSLGGQRERARVTAFKENMRGLVTTFTACADGGGTIYTGEMNGTSASCSGSTTVTLGNVPKVGNCTGSGNVSITTSPTSGDRWQFTSVCTRSSGSPATCTATCNADGCSYAGTCE